LKGIQHGVYIMGSQDGSLLDLYSLGG